MELALRDAIARELPNTKHVVCIWHILSKLSSWLSFPLGSRFEDFKAEFDLLCHEENVEDFEHQWNLLVARFELVTDKHMALLFSYRGFWSISYIRGSFLARTMAPEFSQSLHTFLKRILGGQTCLQASFEQIGLAATVGNQTRDGTRYMHIKTCLPIEEHARSVLTPYAFNVLQHEIVLSLQYAIQEMADGSYLVQHIKKMDGERFVNWMPEDEQIHCSCKEFEHSGILCRHSLRLLEVKNYFQLPERYFPLRWRRDQSLVPMDDQNAQSNNDECAQAFHALAEALLTESLISKERFNHVQREITGLLAEVRSMPVAEELSLNIPPNNVSET